MRKPNRRHFLQKLGAFSATAFLGTMSQPAWSRNLQSAIREAEGVPADTLAGEEDFWQSIRDSFSRPKDLINLNNGGVSPTPKMVEELVIRNYSFSNEAPSFNMWRVVDKGREDLRKNLARLAGVSPEEIAMNRNSSEGLETVIYGLQLRPGDEVILTKQDYPNMINAWKQREKREGIRLVWLDLELPSESEEYFVKKYEEKFTDKTRVVHITQVINWTGQILPVRKIAEAAHAMGIEVVVDGAHSFAHFDFKVADLGCDYFATSLHKWLLAPIGTGMLYVKKDKISRLYPLFGAAEPESGDIRKYEALGTRPFFIEQATSKAVEFYDMIGAERKEKRLYYLKEYWMEKVKDIKGVRFNTSRDPAWACAIGNVQVGEKKPAELDWFLLNKYRIHTVAIEWENIRGIRVTPNVYTHTRELDLLVEAIARFSKG